MLTQDDLARPGRAAPSHPGGSVYYRFTDAQGRLHIVDSLERVPGPLRARAERIELTAPPAESPPGSAGQHAPWTAFGLGMAAALGMVLLVWALRGRAVNPLLKLALVGGLVVLMGAAYLGWVRRQSGQSASFFASPSALIDDARRTVDQANRRQREQQKALDELEHEAR